MQHITATRRRKERHAKRKMGVEPKVKKTEKEKLDKIWLYFYNK